MDKAKEDYCLSKLRDAMEDAPVSHYCFFGTKEDAVCIDKADEWTVFLVERGIKRDIKVFSNIVEAGLTMIRWVYHRGPEAEERVNKYLEEIVIQK